MLLHNNIWHIYFVAELLIQMLFPLHVSVMCMYLMLHEY